MFGTYRFSFQPAPGSPEGDPSFTMTFSGNADLKTIISHFENFLRASGYPLDFDKELVIIPSSPQEDSLSEEVSKGLQEIIRGFTDDLKFKGSVR